MLGWRYAWDGYLVGLVIWLGLEIWLGWRFGWVGLNWRFGRVGNLAGLNI